jgi:hypothetical protein
LASPASSESDFLKPSADVVLMGAVFAPNRTPVRSVIASLTLGEMARSVEVFCDRAMMLDDSIQEGSGFADFFVDDVDDVNAVRTANRWRRLSSNC